MPEKKNNVQQPIVVVTRPLPADWLTLLKPHCQLIVGEEGKPFDWRQYLKEAEGLFCLLTEKIDETVLQQAPKLRVIGNMAVGYDNVDIAACTRRKIPVGNTPGVLTDATADLALALLLAASRRLPEAALDAREGRWTTWNPTGWLGQDLKGATLGIIGMGKIGKAVAERAKAFGMRLIYSSRKTHPEVEQSLQAKKVSLEELAKQSDFISLHAALNSETKGMIHSSFLRQMKPTAILINTARGGLVDTAALQQALVENRIGGAALDVTDPEPLPPSHPLYLLKNCLILPHIGSATWGTRKRMAELTCRNILVGLQHQPLPHCVNPEIYS